MLDICITSQKKSSPGCFSDLTLLAKSGLRFCVTCLCCVHMAQLLHTRCANALVPGVKNFVLKSDASLLGPGCALVSSLCRKIIRSTTLTRGMHNCILNIWFSLKILNSTLHFIIYFADLMTYERLGSDLHLVMISIKNGSFNNNDINFVGFNNGQLLNIWSRNWASWLWSPLLKNTAGIVLLGVPSSNFLT